MLITQYTKVEQLFAEVKISFPPESKTGEWGPTVHHAPSLA